MRTKRTIRFGLQALVAASLCGWSAGEARAQTVNASWELGGSADVYSGSAGNSIAVVDTSKAYTIKVAAFSASSAGGALSAAYVSRIDTNGTMPMNTGTMGGVGVTNGSEAPTTTNPYAAQADNQGGFDFLVFALPADDWAVGDAKFHLNEAYTSSGTSYWAKGRTDVTWWVGGTLAQGGTDANPFANFAGKTLAQITSGWLQDTSTGSSGDRTITNGHDNAVGRYLIIAAEVPNNTSGSTIDGFFVDKVFAHGPATCNDQAAPTFTAPGDVTVATGDSCGVSLPDYLASITDEHDDCTNPIRLQSQFPVPGSWMGEGTSTVDVIMADESDKATLKSFTFTVTDPPVIDSCPGDRAITADEYCQQAVPDLANGGELSATDACTGTGGRAGWAYAQSPAAGTSLAYGSHTVTLSATDSGGNQAVCQTEVALVDASDPIVTCPPSLSLTTDWDACVATGVDAGYAVAEDNCSGAADLDILGSRTDDDSLSLSGPYGLGSSTIAWTATDASGNGTACEQVITVTDAQAPALECPPDLALPTDPGLCSASGYDLGSPVATDNCDALGEASSDAPADGVFFVGSTDVAWQVTDGQSNVGTCGQIVTVTDGEAPTLTCPDDVILVSEPTACKASFGDLGTPSVADNCEGATWANDALFPYGVGTSLVTWTAQDEAGNEADASCGQEVTVLSAASLWFMPPLAGQPVANQINDGSQKVPIKVRIVDCAGLPIYGGIKVVLEVEGIYSPDGGVTQTVIEDVAEDPNGRGDVVDGEALMVQDGTSGQYQFNIDTTNWGHSNTIADPKFYYLATVSIYDEATSTFLGSDDIVLETRPKSGK